MKLSRRSFLQMTGTAAMTGPHLVHAALPLEPSMTKIDRIDLFPMRYPMVGYFKFFTGPHGSAGRAAVIVKITASDGTVGWGQSVPIAKWSYETLETATVAMRDYFAAVLLGRDPTDLVGAHKAMDQAIAPGFSTGMPITRAGLDIALHDLTGKLQNKPISALFTNEKKVESLTLSWTVNVRKLDEVEAVVALGRKRGYQHFNIKVAPNPDFDVELARRVRELEPDCFLWADANGGYEVEQALAVAPRLADVGVNVLEAPLKPNRLRGYQALKKLGALPILMDEGIVSPVELEEFIAMGMIDGVAMKPARCGGLWSNSRQIELCQQHDLMWLGSGLTDPDISMAATLGLYGAYGLKYPAALNGPQFLTTDVLRTPFKIENGSIQIPTGPGLGIQVDEEKVIELMKKSGGDKLLES